jgi:ABC-type uncharacterized transport system permease subunit
MVGILNVANWLLPILYLGLLFDYGAAFFLRTRTHGRSPALPLVLGFHALFLAAVWFNRGRPAPVSNYEVVSLLALATGAVYAIIETASGDRRTGVFVLLAVFLLQYTSAVFMPRAAFMGAAAAEQAHGTGLHIIPAIVAYTGFTIAAIYGLLHLLARRDLRAHKFGLFFDRLPPLELLGKMTWHAVGLGFIFVTIAIVSGAVMYAGGGHGAEGMNAKILIKILAGAVAWLVYASAVAGRIVGRWDYARVAVVAVAGYAVVVAMLVASAVLS